MLTWATNTVVFSTSWILTKQVKHAVSQALSLHLDRLFWGNNNVLSITLTAETEWHCAQFWNDLMSIYCVSFAFFYFVWNNCIKHQAIHSFHSYTSYTTSFSDYQGIGANPSMHWGTKEIMDRLPVYHWANSCSYTKCWLSVQQKWVNEIKNKYEY